jgi:threonyl-tRNA synthetase
VLLCAVQVRKQLRGAKLLVDVDTSDRTMQKKVREAQLSQYNYIFVIGDQEMVRQNRSKLCGTAAFRRFHTGTTWCVLRAC